MDNRISVWALGGERMIKTVLGGIILLVMVQGVQLPGTLLDVYRKGVIKLIPDEQFASGCDWESLFTDSYRSLVVTSDGTIFVANSRTHNFYRFDPLGRLANTYSRRGQGPGDLNGPKLTSILDHQHLVFGEYALDRTFSLFDFKGRFTHKVRVKASCFNPVGLKDGGVAYYSNHYGKETLSGKSPYTVTLHFYDVQKRTETEVPFGSLSSGSIPMIGGGVLSPSPSYLGGVVLSQTADGHLLAGRSNEGALTVFSKSGQVLGTIDLKITPAVVTPAYIQREKAQTIADLSAQIKNQAVLKNARKSIDESDYGVLFAQHLPHYKTVVVDDEGNLLVFLWPDSLDKAKEIFRAYRPSGEFVCETVLDKGEYALEVSPHFRTLQFTPGGLYAIVTEVGADERVRLIKVRY